MADSPSDLLARGPRLAADLDRELDLDPLFIDGVAPWMPLVWAGRQLVTLTRRAASINPTGMGGGWRQVPSATSAW